MALTLYDITWIRMHAYSRRFPAATRVTVVLPRQDIYAQLALTTHEWGGGVGVFFRSYSHAPSRDVIHGGNGDPILNTLRLPNALNVTAELTVYGAWAYAAGTVLHLSPGRAALKSKRGVRSFALVAHDARTGRVLLTHRFIATHGAALPSPDDCVRQVRGGAAETSGLAAARIGILRCDPDDLMRSVKVDIRRKVLIDDATASAALAKRSSR